MSLTREQVRQKPPLDFTPVPFPMPEWGGDVLIKKLLATQKFDFDAKCNEAKLSVPQRCLRFACECTLADDGTPILNSDDPADIEWLDRQGPEVVDRLLVEIYRVNGIGSDAAKNSKTPTSGSVTS